MPNQQSYPDVKDFEHASRNLAALQSKLAKLDAARTELDAELAGRQTKLKDTEAELAKAYGAFDESTATKLEDTLETLKSAAQRFAKMLSARGEAPGRAALEQEIVQAQLTVRDLHAKWWSEYEEACRERAIEWLGLACIAARATGHTNSREYLESRPVMDSLHAAVEAREEEEIEYPVPRVLGFKVDPSMLRRPDREPARIAAREERARQQRL